MIKQITAVLVGGALLLGSLQASAAMITYDFYKLTNNNTEDLSGQLYITMWDSVEANTQFAGQTNYVALATNQVLFTVQNQVGIASNIAEIYFDDGLLGPSVVYNSLGTDDFTEFTGGGANPSNLPGGAAADPVFQSSTNFSADVVPGDPSKGLNEYADILGIRLGVGSYADFDAIAAAVGSGDLRFGLHVRSIGTAGGSDSYVNNPPDIIDPEPNPAPVPGTLLLMGLGLLGVARSRRWS